MARVAETCLGNKLMFPGDAKLLLNDILYIYTIQYVFVMCVWYIHVHPLHFIYTSAFLG